MKNSFNIAIDKYILRSTDDYHVIAEIVLAKDYSPILQWYREESGFTFKFLAKTKFADNQEELKTFMNLFRILIDIINSFMLEDDLSMRFDSETLKDFPILRGLLKQSGLMPLEEEEKDNEDVDTSDPLDYDEQNDDYWYDWDDDTYFFGRED